MMIWNCNTTVFIQKIGYVVSNRYITQSLDEKHFSDNKMANACEDEFAKLVTTS